MPRDRYDDEDDADDDRPRRRRRYDDDADDNRPRRRRRRDDDDFDRPPPRKKSGAGIVFLVLGIVAGVILLVSVPIILLMLPAIQKVRESRDRLVSGNNLKQVALAAHNFESNTNSLSRPFLDTDERGIQVDPPADPSNRLSWRVSLLPFLGDQNAMSAYRRFNIREGWNSPTNAPLKDTPVQSYRHPKDVEEGGEPVTRLRCFYDNGALFESKPHTRTPILSVTDGLSNTIMFVESTETVPWTPFNDFRYVPSAPLPALGHPRVSGGSNVVFADGSVRFIRSGANPETVKAAITRAGGEISFLE